MTTLTTTLPSRFTSARTRTAGVWCLVAGLVGAAQAAVTLGWPEQVLSDRYSYPFTPTWYLLAQATFALQHLPLALGVAALATTPTIRSHRVARGGLRAATAGLALLALTELVALSAAHAGEHSTRGNLVSDSYAIPVVPTGIGLLVAGTAMLRHRAAWSRTPLLPWLVLTLGGYVFFPLTPAISGSFLAGRLGIGGWMLLFALLGLVLARRDEVS